MDFGALPPDPLESAPPPPLPAAVPPPEDYAAPAPVSPPGYASVPPQAAVAQPPPQYAWPGLAVHEGRAWIPAGFWPRLGAFLMDMIILAIAHSLLVWIAGIHAFSFQEALRMYDRLLKELAGGAMYSARSLQMLREFQRPMLLSGWLNVALCAAYFTTFHGLAGATLGKLALGLRVLRRDGRPLGIGWALARYLGYFLFAKLAYTAWLLPFDAQRRTLYDMLLGTNVFRPLRRS